MSLKIECHDVWTKTNVKFHSNVREGPKGNTIWYVPTPYTINPP